MKDVDIVKEAMYVKRVKPSKLAELCGYKNQANINSVLSAKEGMRTTTLAKLVSALGYDVLVVDRKDPKQFFKVTDASEGEAPVRYSIDPSRTDEGAKYTGKTYEELYSIQKEKQDILMNPAKPKEEREAAKADFVELSIILRGMPHKI